MVQRRCDLKLPDRIAQPIFLFVEDSEIVVRHGLVRNQLDHLFELGKSLPEFALLLKHNAQIEVSMGQLGMELLHLFELRDGFGGLPRPEQG